jgi:hypothetical protein
MQALLLLPEVVPLRRYDNQKKGIAMKSYRMRVFADGHFACRTVLVAALAVAALAVTPAFASAAEWSFEYTPSKQGSEGYQNILTSVSCVSATSCVAVGNNGGLSWNGTEWSIQTGTARDSGVSCSSSLACEAVGLGSSGLAPTASAWNGTEWKAQVVPKPEKWLLGISAAVSCYSSTTCMMVGSYASTAVGGEGKVYADKWNGSEWKAVSIPQPAEVKELLRLTGISCTSATVCMATGSYKNTAGVEKPFAESWNGTEWKLLASPKAFTGGFGSVSCSSSTSCTTTGSGGEVAAGWNGTEWKSQSIPRPETADESWIAKGVSCTSATVCTAVGEAYSNNRTTKEMFAAFWNGTTWTVQSTPRPKEREESTELNAVSCSSETKCTAVGSFSANGFAEIYK